MFGIGIAAGSVILLVALVFVIVGSFRGGTVSYGASGASGAGSASSTGATQAPSPSSSSSGVSARSAPAEPQPRGSSTTAPSSGFVPLSGWKLTLPVSSTGELGGKAQELAAAAVIAPWLTRAADGSLVFWAPSTGATTPNSGHSRTELIADSGFGFGSGEHTLAATLTVTQAPAKDPDIIVGQLHGNGANSAVPFVMVHWRDQSIVAVIKDSLTGSDSQTISLLSGVPLNSRFSYAITDDGNGSVTVTAACGSRSDRTTVRAAGVFQGSDVRFQAGDYQQATAGTSSADGGRVTFSSITAS